MEATLLLAVYEPVDEAHRLPLVVDRAALVVDEASVEADPLNRIEGQIALDLRRFLRPPIQSPSAAASVSLSA